ncbi:universal stress protein [Streptomyces sp. NPDC055059]
MLSETTSGWSQKYPDVALRSEVVTGHPVEEVAGAAEHALALVLGRHGRGGYTGIRLGSVVHALLHRAHCPVIPPQSIKWTLRSRVGSARRRRLPRHE